MTTVGYGDYYAKSNAGRFMAILISMWGVFFVNLFVVALTNIFKMELSEERSYILLTRLQIRLKMRFNACRMIESKYLLKQEYKKKNVN